MAGNDNDLARQLERLESKLNDLEAAANGAKMAGRIMTVLVAVVAITMVVMLMGPFHAAYKNPKPFQDKLTKDFQAEANKVLQVELAKFKGEVVPAYQNALANAGRKREAEIAGLLEREANLLRENVVQDLTDQMLAFQNRLVETQKARLEKEFPELADPDQAELILGRLTHVSEAVATRMINDIFGDHYAAITALETSFNSIDVPEKIREMNDDQLGRHVSDLVADLLSVKFQTQDELTVGK